MTMLNQPKTDAPLPPTTEPSRRLAVRTHVQAGTLTIRPRKAPRFPIG
jgi:hypothetical protein